jgi:hypothetical protein
MMIKQEMLCFPLLDAIGACNRIAYSATSNRNLRKNARRSPVLGEPAEAISASPVVDRNWPVS